MNEQRLNVLTSVLVCSRLFDKRNVVREYGRARVGRTFEIDTKTRKLLRKYYVVQSVRKKKQNKKEGKITHLKFPTLNPSARCHCFRRKNSRFISRPVRNNGGVRGRGPGYDTRRKLTVRRARINIVNKINFADIPRTVHTHRIHNKTLRLPLYTRDYDTMYVLALAGWSPFGMILTDFPLRSKSAAVVVVN